jgi:hypothetical protein
MKLNEVKKRKSFCEHGKKWLVWPPQRIRRSSCIQLRGPPHPPNLNSPNRASQCERLSETSHLRGCKVKRPTKWKRGIATPPAALILPGIDMKATQPAIAIPRAAAAESPVAAASHEH